MAEVWTRATRQRQPQGAVAVNWANPITRELLTVMTGTAQADLVAGRSLLRYGGASIAPSKTGTAWSSETGLAFSSTSTTNQGVENSFANPPNFNKSSFLQIVEIDAWDNFSALWSVPYAAGSWNVPYAAVGLQRYGTFNKLRWWGNNSGVAADIALPSATVTAGGKYVIAMSGNAGTVRSVINGQEEFLTGYAGSIQNPNGQPFNILNRSRTFTGEGTSGRCSLFAYWTRDLSSAELRSLSANPWQLFAPERRVSYFFPASAIPTLSAATAVSIGSTTATPRVTVTF